MNFLYNDFKVILEEEFTVFHREESWIIRRNLSNISIVSDVELRCRMETILLDILRRLGEPVNQIRSSINPPKNSRDRSFVLQHSHVEYLSLV